VLRPETYDEAAFRQEVREWIDSHLPAPLRFLAFRPSPEAIAVGLRRTGRATIEEWTRAPSSKSSCLRRWRAPVRRTFRSRE
jgi:hypothetical protein